MQTIIRYLPTIYKAIVAAVLSGVAVYGGVLPDGVTLGEWGYVIFTAFGVGIGTWAKRNAPVPGAAPTVEGPQHV